MRKFVAGLLIRAAHRIYRPKVTEFRAAGTFARPTISTGSGSGTDWRPDMAGSIPLPPVERTEFGWVATVAAGPYMNTRIAALGTQPTSSGPMKCW